MNNVEKIQQNASTAAEYAKLYCSYLSEVLSTLDYQAIGKATDMIVDAHETNSTVYIIGNGGSAATASHMANDFSIGVARYSKGAPKFISLTDNNAVMTAIANDSGYDEVFKQQLEAHLRPNDLVIAISASGNSPNIVKAIEYTKSIGAKVLGFSGFDGGRLKEMATHCITVETPKGEYGPVEDVHMILDHLISTYLMGYFQKITVHSTKSFQTESKSH